MNAASILRQIAVLAKGAGLPKPYLVGGAVRDSLLGKKPDDYDITCGSRECLDLAKLTARHFDAPVYKMGSGAIKVVIDGIEFDFSPGNLLTSEEGLESETRARDFTINSLLIDLETGDLIDLTGGLEDLRNRTLRECTVGLVAADVARVLRAIRHMGDGFAPDDSLRSKIIELIPNTSEIQDRYRRSLANKAIRSNPDMLHWMAELGIIKHLPMTKYIIEQLKIRRMLGHA